MDSCQEAVLLRELDARVHDDDHHEHQDNDDVDFNHVDLDDDHLDLDVLDPDHDHEDHDDFHHHIEYAHGHLHNDFDNVHNLHVHIHHHEVDSPAADDDWLRPSRSISMRLRLYHVGDRVDGATEEVVLRIIGTRMPWERPLLRLQCCIQQLAECVV